MKTLEERINAAISAQDQRIDAVNVGNDHGENTYQPWAVFGPRNILDVLLDEPGKRVETDLADGLTKMDSWDWMRREYGIEQGNG